MAIIMPRRPLLAHCYFCAALLTCVAAQVSPGCGIGQSMGSVGCYDTVTVHINISAGAAGQVSWHIDGGAITLYSSSGRVSGNDSHYHIVRPVSSAAHTFGYLTTVSGPPPPTPSSCSFESANMCGWTESGSNRWTRGMSTPSSNTGPTSAHDGSWFMFLETSGGRAGATSYLISPAFSGMDRVTFYYHMKGRNMGTLSVQALIGNAWGQDAWSRQGQQHAAQSTPWTAASVTLPTDAVQLRFKGTRGNSWAGDMSIDLITIIPRISSIGYLELLNVCNQTIRGGPSNTLVGGSGGLLHFNGTERCCSCTAVPGCMASTLPPPVGQTTSCTQCAPGKYTSTAGATTCSVCPAGGFATATSCTNCSAGTIDHDSDAATPCRDCAAGTYNDMPAAVACSICPAGTYSAAVASISIAACINCSAGTSDHDSDAATPCRDCAAGTYNDMPAVVTCSICPAGTYSAAAANTFAACINCSIGTSDHDSDAATPCQDCAAGTYNDMPAAVTCSICPAGTYSAAVASITIAACINCSAGTSDHDSDAATPCRDCTAGRYSSAVGVTACTGSCWAGSISARGSSSAVNCSACNAGMFGGITKCYDTVTMHVNTSAGVGQISWNISEGATSVYSRPQVNVSVALSGGDYHSHYQAVTLAPSGSHTFGYSAIGLPPVPSPGLWCNFEYVGPYDPASMCEWTQSGDNEWTRGQSTPTSHTGAGNAFDGVWFMFLEASRTSVGVANYLISPRFSGMTNVSFHYHMHGTAMGTLSVQTLIGSTWLDIWSRQGQQQTSQSAPWTAASMALSVSAVQLRFKGTRGTVSSRSQRERGDMSIDAVTILPGPAPIQGYWELLNACNQTIGGGPSSGLIGGSGGLLHFNGTEQCCSCTAAPGCIASALPPPTSRRAFCAQCAPGKYTSTAGATVCSVCPAGGFATATSCTNCSAGTSDHDSDAATPCQDCAAGTYSSAVGATDACTGVCPAGSASSLGSVSAVDCRACDAGKHAITTTCYDTVTVHTNNVAGAGQISWSLDRGATTTTLFSGNGAQSVSHAMDLESTGTHSFNFFVSVGPVGPPDCYTGDGAGYSGTTSTTVSGLTCQQWALDTPHSHGFNGLPANHCRNPDGEPMPWCYTTDPSTRWAYCDIPQCSAAPTAFQGYWELLNACNQTIGGGPSTGLITSGSRGTFQFDGTRQCCSCTGATGCVASAIKSQGTVHAMCTPCTPGKFDDDLNPATPCATCPAGRHSVREGWTACPATISVIGYTSFEEPTITDLGGFAAMYFDSLGGLTSHALLNNVGQNPVSYTACSEGSEELGFVAYYQNTNSQTASEGLADGDMFGVIGDMSTPMNGDGQQGGYAPHGSQYYAMEEAGGWGYVQIDPVWIADHT
jgi:hypothetical protein